MSEVENRPTNGSDDAQHHKKRKGFWSNVFNRSSKTGERKDDHGENQHGLADSLATHAAQAAGKEVVHLAADEAMKEVEGEFKNSEANGNGGSDPVTAASDAFHATTNWAKRMVDSAQQKVQNIQQNLSS